MRRPRTQWILEFQGMMVLTANQIWWTAEVENVFDKLSQGNKRAMKEVMCENCERNVRHARKKIFLSYIVFTTTQHSTGRSGDTDGYRHAYK